MALSFLLFLKHGARSPSSAKEVAHFHLRMIAGTIRGVCLCSLALEGFESLDRHESVSRLILEPGTMEKGKFLVIKNLLPGTFLFILLFLRCILNHSGDVLF